MKKTVGWIYVLLGIAMIFYGWYVQGNPAESYSTTTTDYASFGGDFYTYEYKATRAAASNAATTANNIRELGIKQAEYVGIGFIFAGILVLLKGCNSISDASSQENSENNSNSNQKELMEQLKRQNAEILVQQKKMNGEPEENEPETKENHSIEV